MSRSRTHSGVDYSWLDQLEVEGPFLSLPVVKATWPNQVDRLGDTDDRAVIFKQSFATWLRAYDRQSPERREEYAALAREWALTVLDDLADWRDLRLEAEDLPDAWEVHSPGQEIRIRADGALAGRGDEGPVVLVRIVPPTEDLRAPGLDGWSATEIDRMSALLRQAGVEVGIVTDGRWWGMVWAKPGEPTGSGVVDAVTWGEEPLLRDAFLTLVDQRRFRAKDPEERLPRLLERSELEAEEITEALGTQVRKSVELLVQSFSEARLTAQFNGEPDPLPAQDEEVYQAAVTVMMRVVFLLFAEERGMLPTEQLYWDSYAIRDILDELKQEAASGEEHLDESYDVWHRLLAVSAALHGGVNYDEMRMPAYGGSLLDPERFPWLSATDERGLRVRVSDRVMLHVLDSVQYARVSGGESRRISFRDIDVEQIGYIYEGLLGYTATTVTDGVMLGLVGNKEGEEPEIPLSTLEELYDEATSSKDVAQKLIDWVKGDQPASKPKTPAALAKLVDKDVDEPELNRLLTPIANGDRDLLAQLVSWGNLIRRDLRDIPLVVPVGGLIVTETPSRKNAGAHYTPRSLAEEVVQHALEPLVYEPGPLQTHDRDSWQLKSSAAILDLKVADIAAGSGAFLVAAARFLAARVTEAWTAEDMIPRGEESDPSRTEARALREVIARCLYGADINPMAVEMCKLSLWLVSLDPTKPFSFVDDKIFCGNSLLGVTSLDQLRYLHIYPDTKKDDLITELVDIDGKLAEATRLRHELASPVVEHDPMRSRDAKERLLHQAHEVTAELRDIADGVIAAGLRLGGKPGNQLGDAYTALSWALTEAYPADGSEGDRIKLDEILDAGLTPTVETDYERWKPLNWVVEAPDVFGEHGGFDAVVGNPPFLGGRKISGANGTNVREWLVSSIAGGREGAADLIAYFFLRALSLLNPQGCLGQIATNTVAQGDTREVGLDQMVHGGFTITRAIQSRSWPAASANLEFAAVWGTRAEVGQRVLHWCDGVWVPKISTLLEPAGRVDSPPFQLQENEGIAFQGCIVLGKGFVLDPDEAKGWIEQDPRNAEVLFPYLNGEDLNSRPDCSSSRWVIDFGEMAEEQARRYELPWGHAYEHVRPERLKKDADKYPRMVHEWWKYWNSRPAMRRAIADLDECLIMARVSKTVLPVRVRNESCPSEACVIFATMSHALQAVLSSGMHQTWAVAYGSTLETRVRYAPSDVFETLPRPESTDRLDSIGQVMVDERREIMLRRELGLTKLYNLVNDPEIQGDPEVDRMREIHVKVDEATMAAYGWDDLPLNHGFHTYRQMERWTVSPKARVEILDRLLELNHKRARAEGQDVPDEGELF